MARSFAGVVGNPNSITSPRLAWILQIDQQKTP
jgi:hypothetical protein